MPETEGRTSEEIEQYFADNNRRFFDRKIKKLDERPRNTNTPAMSFENNAFN